MNFYTYFIHIYVFNVYKSSFFSLLLEVTQRIPSLSDLVFLPPICFSSISMHLSISTHLSKFTRLSISIITAFYFALTFWFVPSLTVDESGHTSGVNHTKFWKPIVEAIIKTILKVCWIYMSKEICVSPYIYIYYISARVRTPASMYIYIRFCRHIDPSYLLTPTTTTANTLPTTAIPLLLYQINFDHHIFLLLPSSARLLFFHYLA